MVPALAAAVLLSLLSACGAQPAPLPPPPEPAAKPPPSSASASAPGSAPKAGGLVADGDAPGESQKPSASGANKGTPPFARVDVKVEDNYPERARLQRAGRLTVEWPDSDDDKTDEKRVDWEPPVLEAGGASKPFRVLCRDAELQLAAYVAAANVATVAREPVLLHPKTEPPETAGDKDPGARVARGAVLTAIGSIASIDHLRFESIGLAADGFARRAKLGQTYTPEGGASVGPKTARYDAELARPEATLYPEPSTKAKFVVAKLTPYPESQGSHRFQKLGAKKGGFTLVKLLHPETTVIGWIEDAALKPATGEVTFEKEHKTGVGRLRGSKMMPLKRGTLLSAPKGGEVVGVVLTDHETPCLKRCDSATPLVAVRACGGVARVTVSKKP